MTGYSNVQGTYLFDAREEVSFAGIFFGGNASTEQVTDAVCAKIRKIGRKAR